MRRILAILSFSVTVQADDIAPVLWYDAQSNAYTVACYWAKQFPKIQTKEKHVLFVAPKTSWDEKAKESAVKLGMSDMLTGKTTVSSNTLSAVSVSTADAAVKMICTDDPQETLKKMGLAPAQIVDEKPFIKPDDPVVVIPK